MPTNVTISPRSKEAVAYDEGYQRGRAKMAKEICFKMIDGYIILLGIFSIIAICNYILF